MGDLISRKALIDFLDETVPYDEMLVNQYNADWIYSFIESAPSVDAVEVVRCKDCKHWDCYGGEDAHKGDCMELVGLESCMYEDDFCSYGERKETGDNGKD